MTVFAPVEVDERRFLGLSGGEVEPVMNGALGRVRTVSIETGATGIIAGRHHLRREERSRRWGVGSLHSWTTNGPWSISDDSSRYDRSAVAGWCLIRLLRAARPNGGGQGARLRNHPRMVTTNSVCCALRTRAPVGSTVRVRRSNSAPSCAGSTGATASYWTRCSFTSCLRRPEQPIGAAGVFG